MAAGPRQDRGRAEGEVPSRVTLAAARVGVKGMRLRLRFGIRSRMLLVTFALGSMFVLYVAFATARQAGRDRESVTDRMRLVAALAAARLDDHVGDISQLLKAMGSTTLADGSATAANDIILRAMAVHMPQGVLEVSLWDTDGRNIGSSELLVDGPRRNAKESDYFVSAMRATSLAIEAPVRAAKSREWTAIYAMPVRRDGRVVAVISASGRLASLPDAIDPVEDSTPETVIAVIDAQGRFLARSVDGDRWIGSQSPMDRGLLLRRLSEGRGSSEVVSVDGVSRIFGIAKSHSLPWLVYVGVPVEAALAPVRASTRDSLLLGLAMLAIGLLLAAWVATRITRPLRELSADAVLLGKGRFEHRSRVRTGSEIGLLAGTFNQMAATLQERIAAGRRSEERLSLALEGSEQALFDWDIAANRIYYSAKASELRGGPAAEAEIAPEEMRAFVHPDDIDGLLAGLQAAVGGEAGVYRAEFRVRGAGGAWVWLRSRGRVVERDADGRALRLVGTDADITRSKATEDELRQRAEFDDLTGLPNRALFNDRIAGALARAQRAGTPVALLFVDIDHFKLVNDTRGHAVGDELLKIAATRLSETVRASDTVARLAGDEFTVILEGLASLAEAQAVAAKLVEALRAPMRIGGIPVGVSASIGVAMLERGEHDATPLLRRADEALYEAKRRGRDRYETRLASVA